MRPETTRRKTLFRRTYDRGKAVSVSHAFYFPPPASSHQPPATSHQPPVPLSMSLAVKEIREGAQSATWNRNRLVFLRKPSNNKGMAETRLAHQLKSSRCNTLISGRLFAKEICFYAHRNVATKCFAPEPTPVLSTHRPQHRNYE
jgi:hypothetical protein